MANESRHYEQYKRNRALLKYGCFDINNSKFLDWVVTISFYAAVHLIEMELAKPDINKHTRSHDERNDWMSRLDKLKPIYKQYHTLYRQSRKARYECFSYGPDKVKGIVGLLDQMETYLLSPKS